MVKPEENRFVWTDEQSNRFKEWAQSDKGKAELESIVSDMNSRYRERKKQEPVERAMKAQWVNAIKHIPFTI